MVTSADEQRFYHILIRGVFVAVAAATLIAFFGEQFWVAELFTHFRLYYLLILALLALIFLHTRHGLLLAVALLLAIPNAWVSGPYLAPIIGGKSVAAHFNASSGVEIVVLNVNYKNDGFTRVAGYLNERDPDIIVVAEFTPAWRDELEFLHESYPYRLGDARRDPWGFAVFSRLPLADAELIDLAETDTVHARFIITVGETELEVFAVHLFPPTSFDWARDRNRQLDDLANRVMASAHQRIVIGDVNLTPFSPYFDRFTDQSGLQDARRVDGFHVTWPTSALPFWIPIDHVLADSETKVATVRAGPDIGSDHFPLEVLLSETARDLLGHDKTAYE